MKFLVDAHLPSGLCALLRRGNHSAIHTSELPDQNKTPDRVINELSIKEGRVVVTKDVDFYHSHLLNGRPWKLLLIRTGNIGSTELKALLERNLPKIVSALENNSLVEVDRSEVRVIL